MTLARNILILTALRFEADGIARGLGIPPKTLTLTLSRGYKGEGTNKVSLSIRVVGPAATRLPDLIPAGCAGVILAGLGGGLSPGLSRGDVVIDERSTLELPLALPRVKFVTADRVIATPADKAAVHRDTGGAVVDMETDIVRAWAERHGLPFASIRAISDTAAEALDPAVLRFVDPAGFTRVCRVAREVFQKPALLGTLWRLRHSATVVRMLAEALRESLR